MVNTGKPADFPIFQSSFVCFRYFCSLLVRCCCNARAMWTCNVCPQPSISQLPKAKCDSGSVTLRAKTHRASNHIRRAAARSEVRKHSNKILHFVTSSAFWCLHCCMIDVTALPFLCYSHLSMSIWLSSVLCLAFRLAMYCFIALGSPLFR